MNLQQLATDSVKRRGFQEDANIPTAARNLYQMEYLLDKAAKLGEFARSADDVLRWFGKVTG